jgi:GNAT superfamily N-acetyltransferase
MKWIKGQYTVTDDLAAMDISMIHDFLTRSYWAKGIDQATVERSLANSLSMGVFFKGAQVGFGRAITDRATFAYLADVFIVPEHRGRGLAQWLVDCFLHHQELQGLRGGFSQRLMLMDSMREKASFRFKNRQGSWR